MVDGHNHQAALHQSARLTSKRHHFQLAENIFIPGHMIFNSGLPPSVLLTWLKIQTLVRGSEPGLFVNSEDLAAFIGKSQSLLFRHLSMLQARTYLKWHFIGEGKTSLAIRMNPTEPYVNDPDHGGSQHYNGRQMDHPDYRSYFPERIMGYISYRDE